MVIDHRTEWLEADGLGGFASGTTSGVRSRRYHALLLSALTPPTGRHVLVNGLDAWLETPRGSFALTTQRYAPGVDHPDGASRIVSFSHEPWPTWELHVDGITIRHELLVEYGIGTTVLSWRVVEAQDPVILHVRPFLSGRDYHATHHENGAFRFDSDILASRVLFRPYDGLPSIAVESNGVYTHAPDWYRNFLYSFEAERGLDATEDLAAPGTFRWTLDGNGAAAVLTLEAAVGGTSVREPSAAEVAARVHAICEHERRRRAALATGQERAAEAYLVRRGRGRTIVAGYPWFTDWGRDTFIAARGLCAAPSRIGVLRDILVEWAGVVSEGMLPNRFPDKGESAEYNSVDASLWYVVAVGELLGRMESDVTIGDAETSATLERAVLSIVRGYGAGTRFGIRMDSDALLCAGVPGQQLTWMDARIGDWVVTPRVGKPVEVQALWLNALAVAARFDVRWRDVLVRGLRSFDRCFWSESNGWLADVIDVDHQRGTRDDTFRPNQILAVGGLPLRIVTGARARRIVDAVETRLLTPIGLRSLAPGSRSYAPSYEGGPAMRDSVYHQGTVWPWLMGPFVDAWLSVRRDTPAARREARTRFLQPLLDHLQMAGLGHVSEIADAEAPFNPRGCPFQAWSLGELIRLAARIEKAPDESPITFGAGRHRGGKRRSPRVDAQLSRSSVHGSGAHLARLRT
jgi:predicted glycogen debranching enzyme